jgi:hypothetical protein
MKKVNPYTGLAILFALIALVLYWLKADAKGTLLLVFLLMASMVMLVQLIQKKRAGNGWGFLLALLLVGIIVQAAGGLFLSEEIYWKTLLGNFVLYAVIHLKMYPKEMF